MYNFLSRNLTFVPRAEGSWFVGAGRRLQYVFRRNTASGHISVDSRHPLCPHICNFSSTLLFFAILIACTCPHLTSASGHLQTLLPPGTSNSCLRASQTSSFEHLNSLPSATSKQISGFWGLLLHRISGLSVACQLALISSGFEFRPLGFWDPGLREAYDHLHLSPPTVETPGLTLTIGSGFLTLRSPPVAGFYSVPLVRVGLAAAEPRTHSFLPFRTSAHSSSSDHLSPSFPPPFQLSTPLPTNPPHPQHTTLLPPPPRPSTYQPSPGLAPAKPRGGPPQIPSFLPSSSLSSRLHESSMWAVRPAHRLVCMEEFAHLDPRHKRICLIVSSPERNLREAQLNAHQCLMLTTA